MARFYRGGAPRTSITTSLHRHPANVRKRLNVLNLIFEMMQISCWQ